MPPQELSHHVTRARRHGGLWARLGAAGRKRGGADGADISSWASGAAWRATVSRRDLPLETVLLLYSLHRLL